MGVFIRRRRIHLFVVWTVFSIFSSSAFPPLDACAPRVASWHATLPLWAREDHVNYVSASKKSTIASDEGTPSGKAREFLEFLQRRYNGGKSITSKDKKDWKKTQRYLYQSSNLLSWEQMEAVVDFLDSRLAPETSRKILQSNPRVLRKSVGSSLVPTANFLLDLWGADLFRTAMEQNPKLLLARGVGYSQRSDQDDKQVLQILASSGLSATAIQDLKRTAPFVFGLSVQKVQSFLNFLLQVLQHDGIMTYSSDLDRQSMNEHQKTVARIITSHPYLLNLSVEKNLRPRIEFLQVTCHMNATDIAKMVRASKGTVLNLAIEENLKPTLTFLKEILAVEEGLPMDSLRKCLLSHPQVLTLSLINLRSKVEYFSQVEVSEMGTDGVNRKSSGSSLAARILRRCPTVYSLSLKDNITPKVELLSRAWGVAVENSDSDASLTNMLQDFPNILTSSLEGNILPTLNFFNRTGYTRLTENWAWIPGSPRILGRYLGASLYNRLLPRWHYCLSQGINVASEDTTGDTLMPSKAPSLNLLVLANDLKFCDSLGLDHEDYANFKETAIPRLKFSSQFDTWVKTGRPIQV